MEAVPGDVHEEAEKALKILRRYIENGIVCNEEQGTPKYTIIEIGGIIVQAKSDFGRHAYAFGVSKENGQVVRAGKAVLFTITTTVFETLIATGVAKKLFDNSILLEGCFTDIIGKDNYQGVKKINKDMFNKYRLYFPEEPLQTYILMENKPMLSFKSFTLNKIIK